MKGLGCLFLLLVVAVLVGEVFLVIWLGTFADAIGGHLTVILVLVALSVVGFKLARYRAKQIPMAMLSGRIGQAAAAMVGAILIAFPGIATAVCGLLLQLPPVQALLSGLMHKVFLAFTAVAMKRMGGMGGMGGMGPMPGGFPGAAAGGAPGAGLNPQQMQQMQAALRAMQGGGSLPGAGNKLGKGGGKPKTYDVRPEK